MNQVKKVPMRQCVSCRQQKPKKELCRIVREKDGTILVDRTGKNPGRGAYICTDPACFQKLKKTRGLNRAFSTEVPLEIYERLEEEIFGKS
ncbi:MAG: RNase P modulator RnpM [Christensenellaceae bacterium]